MTKTHEIPVGKLQLDEFLRGGRPYEYVVDDKGFKEGDEIHYVEFENEKETGRMAWASIVSVRKGPEAGIPQGHCIFTQYNQHQIDFRRDYDHLSNHILPKFEEKLSYKHGNSIVERINHVLASFEGAATDSIFRAKNFIDDVKTQFKAFELMMEGLTSDALNHGQKRVIANHIITMIRQSVDRIDGINWEYSEGMRERFNYFRSQSPEGNLLNKYRELREQNATLKNAFKELNDSLPGEKRNDLPF